MIFASATRDELWIGGRRIESRLQYGVARQRDDIIEARDERDDELVRACEEEMERLRACVVRDARVRLVATAQREGDVVERSATMTVAIGELSIVTSPEHFENDLPRLECGGGSHRVPSGGSAAALQTFVWHNGSAAVLLHEAIGHAAEHGHAPLAWPSWLTVHDEDADLLQGPPKRMRRESFRDVPLPRMTNLIARQQGAPFELPDDAIDIHLVSGGAYDPLTEVVTLDVSLAFANGHRVAPFTIRRTRAEVARALIGASGEAIRYPGVVCSSEGQELFVGSHAPVMITSFG